MRQRPSWWSAVVVAGTCVLVPLLAWWANGAADPTGATAVERQCSNDCWYNEYDSWAASHAAAVAAMQQQLLEARKAALGSDSLTTAAATTTVQGSALPKGVSLKHVKQLLVDKQVLSLSLNSSGFAAARVAAIRRHHSLAGAAAAAAAAAVASMGPAAAAVEASSGGSGLSEQSAGSGAAEQPEHATSSTPQVQQHQDHHHHHQQQQAKSAAPSRGILIVGGSRTHLGNAYILLRMLRDTLNCSLPVEVVYYGNQELDPLAARLVTAFATQQAAAGAPAIRLINGLLLHRQHLQPLRPHPEARLTSWVAKVHALCWVTSFQQVLLLDSDNMPTQDPAPLFQDSSFTAHGFLTWPDFWHDLWMHPGLYTLLGLPIPWEADPQGLAAESGQVLLDRARHADVLEWLWLLNAHSRVVYRCLIGDKDTYRMAFQLAGKGQDYVQVAHPPRQLLLDTGSHQQRSRFIHLGMGQASPDGRALLFMHRTARGKYFPWCAASLQLQQGGAPGCQPSWLTQPVVQEQLLASVDDPGSMRFDAARIDTGWHATACTPAADAAAPAGAGAGAGAAVAGAGLVQAYQEESPGDRAGLLNLHGSSCGLQPQSPWKQLQLPVCSNSTGQLPIPVIPVDAVAGLQQLMAAVGAVFAEAAAVLPVSWHDRWKVFWGIL